MFKLSEKAQNLREQLTAFMDQYVYPNEHLFHEQVNKADNRWAPPTILEELKAKAKAVGLWNLFLPESEFGQLCFEGRPLFGRAHPDLLDIVREHFSQVFDHRFAVRLFDFFDLAQNARRCLLPFA